MFGSRKRIGYIAPDRHGGRAVRILPLCARRRRPRRRDLQHRRLEPGLFRAGARAGHDRGDLSRLARRRFHPPWRRAARGRARQGLRGDHRQGHRGRRARCRPPPACAPPWRRCVISARAASRSPRPIRSGTTARCRAISPRTASTSFAPKARMCRSRSCRTCRPRDIQHFASDVLGARRDCDALYLPCPQWQAAQSGRGAGADCGVPAVAYTHASFFAAFKTLGMNDAIRGHGRLLASLAERMIVHDLHCAIPSR